MVYQILISTMYLQFSNFYLVFMIVGLMGEDVVIAEDFRPLIPPLCLSSDNITGKRLFSTYKYLYFHSVFGIRQY